MIEQHASLAFGLGARWRVSDSRHLVRDMVDSQSATEVIIPLAKQCRKRTIGFDRATPYLAIYQAAPDTLDNVLDAVHKTCHNREYGPGRHLLLFKTEVLEVRRRCITLPQGQAHVGHGAESLQQICQREMPRHLG